MGDNVVNLNSETLFYITNGMGGKEIIGVGDSAGMIEFIDDKLKGVVHVCMEGSGEISKEKFKSLCIAWIAMNSPEILKEDKSDEEGFDRGFQRNQNNEGDLVDNS